MLTNEGVDHEARTVAARAEQKIDSHEDRCAERWKEARDASAVLSAKIDGLVGRIWWFVGGIGAAMFATIVWLLDKVG